MNIDLINFEINLAYNNAIKNGGQRLNKRTVFPNITIKTDSYTSKTGNGFRVVCIVKRNDGAFVKRVKNYGPDINSEIEWPEEGIEIALQNAVKPYCLP